jgi:PHD/YefM family antitoxin component YafN of YafNO toxin-antitoxin module
MRSTCCTSRASRRKVCWTVLPPSDDYDELEEAAEILSDPDAMTALEAGLAEVKRGEIVSLQELREELANRRASG